MFDWESGSTLLEEYLNCVPIAGGTENIETLFELDSDTALDNTDNNSSDSDEL